MKPLSRCAYRYVIICEKLSLLPSLFKHIFALLPLYKTTDAIRFEHVLLLFITATLGMDQLCFGWENN